MSDEISTPLFLFSQTCHGPLASMSQSVALQSVSKSSHRGNDVVSSSVMS